MTYLETPSDSDQTLFTRVHASVPDMMPVGSLHKILPSQNQGLIEFSSHDLNGRYIALGDEHLSRYAALQDGGLPTFEHVEHHGLQLIQIPDGSRPLSGFAQAMSRNPQQCRGLVSAMGAMLGRFEELGIAALSPNDGEPAGILHQFAVTPLRYAPGGVRVMPVAPYNFAGLTPDRARTQIASELRETGAFDQCPPDTLDKILEYIDEGWHRTTR